MVLLMVSICSSFVLLGSALTPEETVAKIDTMLSSSNLYKPKEIELFKEYVLKTQRKYSDELEISARMGYFKEHLRLKPDSESQYCPHSDFSDRSRKEILQRTAMVEAQVAIHTKQPVISLSKSQLVECDYGDYGCRGGNVDGAWLYITQNGYETEGDYPYRNREYFEGKCAHDEKKSFLYIKEKGKNISNSVGISKAKPVHLTGNIMKHFEGEENIKRVLVNHGPVTVSLVSYYLDSEFDFSKILKIDAACCASHKVGHMVVIVGYGVENGTKYWIVRNSWGETYADKGYVKLERGINVCYIEQDASAIIIVPTSLV